MSRDEVIPLVCCVVDDAGCGRRLGQDIHAIVREVGKFKYASRVVYWGEPGDEPLAIAVHSYLDVWLNDNEAIQLAIEYLNEIGDLDHSWHNISEVL